MVFRRAAWGVGALAGLLASIYPAVAERYAFAFISILPFTVVSSITNLVQCALCLMHGP